MNRKTSGKMGAKSRLAFRSNPPAKSSGEGRKRKTSCEKLLEPGEKKSAHTIIRRRYDPIFEVRVAETIRHFVPEPAGPKQRRRPKHR
jgi:hypothetical protein